MRAQLVKNTELIKGMFTKKISNDVYDNETTTLFNTLIDNNKCLSELEPAAEHNKSATQATTATEQTQVQPQDGQQVQPQDSQQVDIHNTVYYKLLKGDYQQVKTTLETNKDNVDVFHSYGMISLLNPNLNGNNIIVLVNSKLVCYQWLGLYLKYNTGCHASDIITLITHHCIHPYLALTMYSYQTPRDYITLYNTYHKKTIDSYEGISVEFGLKDIIAGKPMEYIHSVLMSLLSIENIDKPIRIYYYGQLLDKHPPVYKHENIPQKLINNISDLKLYVDNLNLYKDKVFVKFNYNLINSIFVSTDMKTILDKVCLVLRYMNYYWLTYAANDHNCYFTIEYKDGINPCVIKDIMTMDINNNRLILVHYLADNLSELV